MGISIFHFFQLKLNYIETEESRNQYKRLNYKFENRSTVEKFFFFSSPYKLFSRRNKSKLRIWTKAS